MSLKLVPPKALADAAESAHAKKPSPENDTQSLRLESRLPPLLSIIAGMVDVLGFFMLGRIFTAHITGNLAVVAAVSAQGNAPDLVQTLTLPVFMLAVAAMWLLARVSDLRGAGLAHLLLVVQFLLLFSLAIFTVATSASTDPKGTAAGIAVLIAVSAMACQFVLFRLAIPGAISTAVMTGNLTNTILYLMDLLSPGRPLMDTEPSYLKRSFKLFLGFVIGCAAGGIAIPLLGDWAWLLPALLAGAAIAVR